MVSLRKLAKLAGVSHAAAWYALHDKPGVSADVRARVLALAEELHYHPNRLVAGVMTGNSRTIGYITPDTTWQFHARVGRGIITAAAQDQTHVITAQMMPSLAEVEMTKIISLMIEQRVDGLIIFLGWGRTVPTKSILELWSHDIVPVLLCDTTSEKPLDHIDTDERRLAQIAVEYLLHLGHQRIAYCGFNSCHVRDQEVAHEFQRRGLSMEYFLCDASLHSPNPKHANAVLDFLLGKPHPPTAIFCHGDNIAMQLLLHAQQRGLRVPGDLSILGCSNNLYYSYLSPPLTTIEQCPEEHGRQAYDLIQRRRQEDSAPGERRPEAMLIPPRLVIRASCDPPGMRRD